MTASDQPNGAVVNGNGSADWKEPSDWFDRPVCVLGGGVLGRRIAACFVAAGHHVIIRDPSNKSREDAIKYIHENISSFTALTGKEAGTCEATEELSAAVKDCWIVFEAVPEILELKENTFLDLEKHTREDCILASNSSSYKSSELVGKIRDETKARVLNTHYMMPPEAVIVELMTCGGHTSKNIFPFLTERLQEAGLHPIVALKESTGFIFNRIWAAIKREVLAVLAEGVSTPETIDSMWIEQYADKKIGPCRLMDAVGLDTVEHIESHYIKERSLPGYHLDWLKDNYIEKGKLGQKSGNGGLYPPKAAGQSTRVLLLNIGLAEPLKGKTVDQVMHSGQVLQYNLDEPNSRPTELVGKLPGPDGIDTSESTGRMYWTNMGVPILNNGSVQSANLDGTDVKFVVETGKVHTPKQLTIDQEANKIYFCDREGLRIWRCNLDGSDLEIIYQSGDWEKEPEKVKDATYWPVGITVSRKLNKFFWTQKGGSKSGEGRIFSAGLDIPAGESPDKRSDIEMIIDKLPEAIDLEIDDEEGVLYWTDRGELPLGNTLNRKHLVGDTPKSESNKTLQREILAQGLGEGIGLRLDKQHRCLYVADMGGHLWRCPMDGGLKEKVYEGPTHAYTGLTFYKY